MGRNQAKSGWECKKVYNLDIILCKVRDCIYEYKYFMKNGD